MTRKTLPRGMAMPMATPAVESPTCPWGQETPDAAAHGDGRRVNLPGWPTELLALLYSVSRLLLEALVDRHHPDADLRLELLASVTNCALSSARASGRAGGLRIASCSPVSASPQLALLPRQPPDPVALASRSRPAQVGPVGPPPQAQTPRSGRDPALVSLTPMAVLQHAPARPAPTGLDE